METVISPRRSLKGYKFKIWFQKNKNTIKMLASAAIGVAIFFLPQIKDPAASAAAGAVAAALTKLAVDSIDFFWSEVEVPVVPATPQPGPPS